MRRLSARSLVLDALETRITPVAGLLDPGFGISGITSSLLDLIPGGSPSTGHFESIIRDTAGKLVAAGQTDPEGDLLGSLLFPRGQGIVVSRLLSDGSPDPTFGGGDGLSAINLPIIDPLLLAAADTVAGITQQTDGKYLVALTLNTTGLTGTTSQVGVLRLNSDGTLDTTFDTDGLLSFSFSPCSKTSIAAGIGVLGDGRIVIGGTGNGNFAVAVLNKATGAFDAAFDGDGKKIIDVAGGLDTVNDLLIQPNGLILLAGTVLDGGVSKIGLVRLNGFGALDNSFDGDGKAIVGVSLGGAPGFAEGNFVTLGLDGSILTGGGVGSKAGDPSKFVAAKLTANGLLDASFGIGGITVLDPGGGGTATGGLLQPNGSVVLTGPGGDEIAAVRLNVSGLLDPTFGNGGISKLGKGISADIALLPDGLGGLGGLGVIVGGLLPDVGLKLSILGVDLGVNIGDPDSRGGGGGGGGGAGQPGSGGNGSPPGTAQSRPGPVTIGGQTNGSAVVYSPSNGQYVAGPGVAFFPGFAGTVRTATADVTGDGIADYIGGTGVGDARVAVIDGATNQVIITFRAFEDTFTGGVYVAAGDLDGDGKAEVFVTPDEGGGPVVAIYDGASLAKGAISEMERMFGIDDPGFRGGARVAVGDVNGDGVIDLVVSAGFLGGPRITIFDGKAMRTGVQTTLANFFAFEESLRNGAFVAVGDVTGDGKADLILGGGPSGGPRVRIADADKILGAGDFGSLDNLDSAQVANFFAGDPESRGGVRMAAVNLDGDKYADVITGSGDGLRSEVRLYTGPTLAVGNATVSQAIDPFGAELLNGVFVG